MVNMNKSLLDDFHLFGSVSMVVMCLPGEIHVVPGVIFKYQGILSRNRSSTEVIHDTDRTVWYEEGEAFCLNNKLGSRKMNKWITE